MILEQRSTLLLQSALDQAGEHAEHAGQKHPHPDFRVFDVDGGLDRFAQGLDAQVQLVAGPSGFDLGPARDVILQAVDIVGDAPPRLVLAEVVREIDFDWL